MRRWLIRGAGGLVILAALAYLALNVAEQRAALAQWRPTAGTWPRLALLAGAYGAALFLLAESWHRIAGAFGTEPRWRTFPSYTATLVARYLPGNVMHLLGRAAWLRGG